MGQEKEGLLHPYRCLCGLCDIGQNNECPVDIHYSARRRKANCICTLCCGVILIVDINCDVDYDERKVRRLLRSVRVSYKSINKLSTLVTLAKREKTKEQDNKRTKQQKNKKTRNVKSGDYCVA